MYGFQMVYTIKRWLALNDEGKAQLRNYFPTLAKVKLGALKESCVELM